MTQCSQIPGPPGPDRTATRPTARRRALGLGTVGALGAGAVLGLGAAAVAPTTAGAGVRIDDIMTPFASSSSRPVFGAKATADAGNFYSLVLRLQGRRSSWSGMRDETDAGAYVQTSDNGHYRKVEHCGISGTYTRASRLDVTGTIPGGTSFNGNGFGSSYTGATYFNDSYDSNGRDITCTASGYFNTWTY